MTLQSYLTARVVDGQHVIAVLKHKTADKPAIVILPPEDFKRLTLYHENLRQPQEGDEIPEDSLFFTRYEGSPHDNVPREIAEFQQSFGYPKYTSTQARKAAETGMQGGNERQQRIVSEYLNHDEATAKRYYRATSMQNAVDAQALINAQCVSMKEIPTRAASPAVSTGSEPDEYSEEFFQKFPLDLLNTPKIKEVRKAFPQLDDAICKALITRFRRRKESAAIKLWLTQNKHAFRNGLPCDQELAAMFKSRKWTTPISKVKAMQVSLEPRKVQKLDGNNKISELCSSQKWKGLVIFNTENTGRGVKVSIGFSIGSVLCNYVARRIKGTYQEQIDNGKDTSYMFCLDKSTILDGTLENNTLGRLINHSSKHPNLRAELFTGTGKDNRTIIFRAIRDILPGEQLLYDYGDHAPLSTKPEWYNNCPCMKCSK